MPDRAEDRDHFVTSPSAILIGRQETRFHAAVDLDIFDRRESEKVPRFVMLRSAGHISVCQGS